MQYNFDSSSMLHQNLSQECSNVNLSIDELVLSNPSVPSPKYILNTIPDAVKSQPTYKLVMESLSPSESENYSMCPSSIPTQCCSTIDSINKKKYNNWFTKIIDQRGEEFLLYKLSCDEVGKNAERIFDDMINGRIDYTKQGKYIVLPTVIKTLIAYCSNEIAINQARRYSLWYAYEDYNNMIKYCNDQSRIDKLSAIDSSLFKNIVQAMVIAEQDLFRYELIYQKLQYIDQTGNISVLLNLPNELGNNRKFIKKHIKER